MLRLPFLFQALMIRAFQCGSYSRRIRMLFLMNIHLHTKGGVQALLLKYSHTKQDTDKQTPQPVICIMTLGKHHY